MMHVLLCSHASFHSILNEKYLLYNSFTQCTIKDKLYTMTHTSIESITLKSNCRFLKSIIPWTLENSCIGYEAFF